MSQQGQPRCPGVPRALLPLAGDTLQTPTQPCFISCSIKATSGVLSPNSPAGLQGLERVQELELERGELGRGCCSPGSCCRFRFRYSYSLFPLSARIFIDTDVPPAAGGFIFFFLFFFLPVFLPVPPLLFKAALKGETAAPGAAGRMRSRSLLRGCQMNPLSGLRCPRVGPGALSQKPQSIPGIRAGFGAGAAAGAPQGAIPALRGPQGAIPEGRRG